MCVLALMCVVSTGKRSWSNAWGEGGHEMEVKARQVFADLRTGEEEGGRGGLRMSRLAAVDTEWVGL